MPSFTQRGLLINCPGRFSNGQTRTRLKAKNLSLGIREMTARTFLGVEKSEFCRQSPEQTPLAAVGVRQSQGDSSIVFLSRETLVIPGMLLSLLSLRCPSRAKC